MHAVPQPPREAALDGRPGPSPAADWSRLLVLLDYDGTITARECNEVVFQRLTGDAWRVFEDAVRRGEMSHAECLDRQVGLVTVPRDEFLAAVVDEAEPAPGLAAFLAALAGAGARVVVVSAGYREAIEAFWTREGLQPVAVYASEVVAANGDGRPPWHVRFNPALGDCPACGRGNCKAGVLRALRQDGDAVVVFGDGVSDLCMAREADLVFARDPLAGLCRGEGIAARPLRDFRDALAEIVDWYAARPPRGPAGPRA